MKQSSIWKLRRALNHRRITFTTSSASLTGAPPATPMPIANFRSIGSSKLPTEIRSCQEIWGPGRMFRRHPLCGRLLLTCLLLSGSGQFASSQTNPSRTTNLAQIETSIQQGKLDQVEKPLLDYAIAHPRDAKALALLAQLRYQQRRFEEAEALYRRVLALDPSLVKAKINLGQLMYELGQHDEARVLLAGVGATVTLSVNERVALARALVFVGEFQKALAEVDRLPNAVKSSQALPIRAAGHLGLGESQRLIELLPSIRRIAVSNPE